jgi:hypothetical protein
MSRKSQDQIFRPPLNLSLRNFSQTNAGCIYEINNSSVASVEANYGEREAKL